MKKLKKIAFTLICSVLVLVPVITNAETVNVKTMEELLTAVKGDNTVVLDDNITLNKALEVNGNNVILDLNGKTITITEKYIDLLKGSLEITGKGTIKDTRALAKVGSTMYVEGSTNKSDTAYSTLTIGKDVTIDTTEWALSVWDTNGKAYGVTVNFDGTIISSGNEAGGITIQGNIKNDGTIINAPVINLGKTTKVTATGSNGFPLYGAGAGIWNIIGGNYVGITGSLGLKSGRFNITGGTFNATGTPGVAEGYGNGINGVGAAIQIESNNSYFGHMSIGINGNPTIISDKGNSIYHYPAQTGSNHLESMTINGGDFTGDIVFQENDKKTVSVKGGTFQTDTIKDYVAKDYKLIKINEAKHIVSNVTIKDVEGATATLVVNGVENKYYAGAGETVTLKATADTGYYIKNITIKDIKGNNITLTDGKFTMPDTPIEITLETARCLDKDSNIVEVPKNIAVDSSINEELAKKLINTTVDNTNSGLVKSLNKEKLQIADTTTLIEVNFDTKLVKYDEKTNTIAYEIKPMYTINGTDYNEIPNEAINGKIKISLPIPSSVKDTYAKVKHISNGAVISEDEYAIKTNSEGGKYITIETESFSTFEISSYYTPKNINPQTGDNITTYIMTLVGSILCIGTVIVLKKRFN